MTEPPDEAHIHVVEDNERIADMYRKWLSGGYEATVSYSGEDALDAINESVDLVLLDRDLPNKDGDEVLEELRDRDSDVVVAMLTATDPGTGLAEMPCDDYVRKPVPEERLLSKVEELVERCKYDAELKEYLALARRAELLEEKYSTRRLEDDDQYNELVDRVKALEDRVGVDKLDIDERPNLDA